LGIFKKIGNSMRGYPGDIHFPEGPWDCAKCQTTQPHPVLKDYYFGILKYPDNIAMLITQSGKTCMCTECSEANAGQAGKEFNGETLYAIPYKKIENHITDPPDWYFNYFPSERRSYAEVYSSLSMLANGNMLGDVSSEKAYEIANKAITFDPSHIKSWYAYAVAAEVTNKHATSVEKLSEALQLHPQDGFLYYARAQANLHISDQKASHPMQQVEYMRPAFIDLVLANEVGVPAAYVELTGHPPQVIALQWQQSMLRIQQALGQSEVNALMQRIQIQQSIINSDLKNQLNDIKRRL